jgi:predicted small lipoprotein YifL
MELRMLRRSVAAFIVVFAACVVASCGIKGPLKLPAAKPAAPEAGGAPSAPATTDAPAPDTPASAPGDKKQ